jgi:hypothetical protein
MPPTPHSGQMQQVAAVSALMAVPLALGSGLVLLAALSFDPRLMLDPASIITIGPAGATLLRWGLVLDVFGYYLLLAPVALHLYFWFKVRSPGLVALFTWCGLAYVLVGAMGAIVLSAVLPPLVVDYANASVGRRELLQVVFSSFLNAVYFGLWNPLEALFFSIWLCGIGTFLQRERRALGVLARLIGVFALLDAVGRILSVGPMFFVGVAGLLAFPIWLPWFAVDLLRRPVLLRSTPPAMVAGPGADVGGRDEVQR